MGRPWDGVSVGAGVLVKLSFFLDSRVLQCVFEWYFEAAYFVSQHGCCRRAACGPEFSLKACRKFTIVLMVDQNNSVNRADSMQMEPLDQVIIAFRWQIGSLLNMWLRLTSALIAYRCIPIMIYKYYSSSLASWSLIQLRTARWSTLTQCKQIIDEHLSIPTHVLRHKWHSVGKSLPNYAIQLLPKEAHWIPCLHNQLS